MEQVCQKIDLGLDVLTALSFLKILFVGEGKFTDKRYFKVVLLI